MATNLVNLERVEKAYGVRKLLAGVSLGVAAGERIGLVGSNGAGKTTLLAMLAGVEPADAGRVTQARGLRVGVLSQSDDLDQASTVTDVVLRNRPEHTLLADRKVRDVLAGLLSDIPGDRIVGGLSGGERRRVALARLLADEHDLLLLDEPTNHLDIEVTDWLARHLVGRAEALVAVTHDRWFLDAICTTTWELEAGEVAAYDGGYAAYVLARAERERAAGVSENKRQNLLRKELAWLRRGAPARTSKPKFRLDAAAALIEGEPPPRDSLGLAKFVSTRLGKTVIDLADVDVRRGTRELLSRVTWQLGPGDRIGMVGINGAGKTTLLRLLAGEAEPDHGTVKWGRTVQLSHLRQELGGLDPDTIVVDAAEEVRRVIKLAPENIRPGAVGRRPVPTSGPEVTAISLLERFGFRGDRLRTRVGDLSGGERRRLELLCLLLTEPNVLLLDEPTNDLDIDTLRVIEDFLDIWPGSLVVVTHDRYFLERVCDSVWALLGDGQLALLPGGVDEYLQRRRDSGASVDGSARGQTSLVESSGPAAAGDAPGGQQSNATELRAARKELARLERQLSRLGTREEELHAALAEHASDYERLMGLDAELRDVRAEKEQVENRWLELAELVE
ncbi:ABC-F family ATP-binding cassette domain-containing protein [Actinopolymorpha alba]|uniref:ABC-F family ATP-binding cassette domain-containing protein n=1 Tax=Actinopolymorpha alba TaxID=533267 RepID=UPI00035CBBBE|nr:ABC-F family ATP-binding cassette domain-containing protein [Actinopolymorpha alba]